MLAALGSGDEADPQAIPQRVGEFAELLLAGLLGAAQPATAARAEVVSVT